MQVRRHAQGSRSRLNPFFSGLSKERKEGVRDLQKADVINDIFNNRAESNDEKKDVKLRLSQTSRFLFHELKEKIHFFLEENKKIFQSLEKIPLPESEYTHRNQNSDLTMRKLSSYLHWLEIQKSSGGKQEHTESEKPYIDIHKEGKDEEIKEIFTENEAKRKEIQQQRSKNVPNYYYLVYPETYAFN